MIQQLRSHAVAALGRGAVSHSASILREPHSGHWNTSKLFGTDLEEAGRRPFGRLRPVRNFLPGARWTKVRHVFLFLPPGRSDFRCAILPSGSAPIYQLCRIVAVVRREGRGTNPEPAHDAQQDEDDARNPSETGLHGMHPVHELRRPWKSTRCSLHPFSF
jgi:hypothetical protein